ncbi:MAG: hypothetical protein J7L47_00620 [Candidatus Odinarchaeota archaeon]|nr:hypothetical protein [Candidatus Odinarchaeota archaeon]
MDDLDLIRRKKMLELMNKMKKAEVRKEQQAKKEKVDVDSFVESLMDDEAVVYYRTIKNENPKLAKELQGLIVQLYYYGYLNRGLITRLDLRYFVRKLTGEETKIYIKKRGEEAVDLEKAIRKKLEGLE